MKKAFLVFSLGLTAVLSFAFFSSLKDSNTMQVEQLIIKNPSSKACIKLQVIEDAPQIVLIDSKGQDRIVLKAEDLAQIVLKNQNSEDGLAFSAEKEGAWAVCDETGKTKVRASTTGVILKNSQENIVGSFSILNDGSGGFGLADADGLASTISRGGANPCFALFGNKPEPIAALGVMQQIPHLIVSGNIGNEGVLIHGGEHSGLMVLNETGQLKVFINKDGIFQNQQQTKVEEKPKYFSFSEDKKVLFPKEEKSIR